MNFKKVTSILLVFVLIFSLANVGFCSAGDIRLSNGYIDLNATDYCGLNDNIMIGRNNDILKLTKSRPNKLEKCADKGDFISKVEQNMKNEKESKSYFWNIIFYTWASIAIPGFLFGGVPEFIDGTTKLIYG